MDELIITVAPNAPQAQLGACPDLPRTPERTTEEVVRAGSRARPSPTSKRWMRSGTQTGTWLHSGAPSP